MIWVGMRSPCCGARIAYRKDYDRIACLNCGRRCGTGKFQKPRILNFNR
jgi:hypothetical protein